MRNTAFLLLSIAVLLTTALLAQQPSEKLSGHSAAVYSVRFSPSGQKLVSTSFDESARIWNTSSLAPVSSFRGHRGIVLTAAFSPDEEQIATGGLDQTIRLWDVPQSEPIQFREWSSQPLRFAEFSRNVERAASLTNENTLLLFDVQEGKSLGSLKLPAAEYDRISLRPDGRTVLVGDRSGNITQITSDPLAIRTQAGFHLGEIVGASYTPNQSYIVSCGSDGFLRRWPGDLPEQRTIPLAEKEVAIARLAPTGKLFATWSQDQKLSLWEPNEGKHFRDFPEQSGNVALLEFSTSGGKLATIDTDHIVRLFQTGDAKLLKTFPALSGTVTCLGWSRDEKQLACGMESGELILLDATGDAEPQVLKGHNKAVSQVVWTSDRKQLISAGLDGTILFRAAETLQETARLERLPPLTRLALVDRTQTLAAGAQDGSVRLIDIASRKVETQWQAHEGAISAFDLSFDGQKILTAGANDSAATVWDNTGLPLQHFANAASGTLGMQLAPDLSVVQWTGTGQITQQKFANQWSVRLPEAKAKTLAISANSGEIAIAFSEGPVRSFNINNGNEERPYGESSTQTIHLAYSPNNTWLVAVDQEKTITLWRMSNRKAENLLRLERDITGLSFSQDSKKLLVMSPEGILQSFSPEQSAAERNLPTDPTRISSPIQEFRIAETELLAVGVQRDHQTALSVTSDGQIRDWRVASNESLFSLSGHRGQIYGLDFHPTQPQLVSVSSDKTVRLWDLETKRALRTLGTSDNVLYDVRYLPGGKTCVTAGANRLVEEYDIAAGRVVRTYQGSGEQLYSVAVSADGKRLAAAGTGLGPEREILVWNYGAIEPVARLTMKSDSIYRVQFSQDGEQLLAVGYNGRVELLSISERKTIVSWDVPAVVYSGALSPDGNVLSLATEGEDVLFYAVGE